MSAMSGLLLFVLGCYGSAPPPHPRVHSIHTTPGVIGIPGYAALPHKCTSEAAVLRLAERLSIAYCLFSLPVFV